MFYEEFKEELSKKLEEVFVKEHGGRVAFTTVNKVNRVVEQVSLSLGATEGTSVGPSFTLESFFDDYENGTSMDDIARYMVDVALKPVPKVDKLFSKEFVLKHASFRLLNAEKNQHLVDGHFTEPFLDLLLVYSVDFEDTDGFCSFLITKGFAYANEITFEELREAARKNIGKPSINTLPELLGIPEEEFCECDDIMLIVGRNKRFGASYLAFVSEWASSIQELYGCDQFVILPSSVEELIVVPYDKENAESQLLGLMAMVSSVNEEVLETDEFLSNSIYLWDGEVVFKVDEHIARSIIAG